MLGRGSLAHSVTVLTVASLAPACSLLIQPVSVWYSCTFCTASEACCVCVGTSPQYKHWVYRILVILTSQSETQANSSKTTVQPSYPAQHGKMLGLSLPKLLAIVVASILIRPETGTPSLLTQLSSCQQQIKIVLWKHHGKDRSP